MARRINTRFVTILGGSALGLVAVIYLADKLLIKPSAGQFADAAQKAMTAHHWADAQNDWEKALQASPQDPDLWTQYGNTLHVLSLSDPQIAAKRRDLAAWQTALEIDPDFVPAVRSLLGYWREQMQINPGMEAFSNSRDTADKFLKLAPKNPDGAQIKEIAEVTSFKYTATVLAWLNGLDTDPKVIDQTETQMRALVKSDPTDPEMPYYLALLDVQRAQVEVQKSPDAQQPQAATDLYQKAAGEMLPTIDANETAIKTAATQPSLKTDEKETKPENRAAVAHYHAAELYNTLAGADHSAVDNRTKYIQLADRQMDRAMVLVKSTDPQFVEISLRAARFFAVISGDADKAKQIVGALLRQPNLNPLTVVQATPLIDGIKDLQPQAIEVLQSAVDAAGNKAEVDARRYLELGALAELEITQFAVAPDGDAKTQLKGQIDHNLTLMAQSGRDPLQLVSDQAHLAMVQKDYLAAIQAISRGMTQSKTVASDPELIWMLAQAYYRADERESSKEWLQKTIRLNPSFLTARKMLIEQLAPDADKKDDAARMEMDNQLSYLQRAAPDDPDVMRLQMLKPDADADQIKTLYGRLPEKTADDLVGKAIVAELKLNDWNEAIRLLSAARDKEPNDLTLVMRLAAAQLSAGQKPDAIATVQQALTKHPDDATLQLGLDALNGATPAELDKLKENLANKNATPFQRDIQLAKESHDAGNPDGEEIHLLAAEAKATEAKAKATDPAASKIADESLLMVWDRLFKLYLGEREYDKAQAYEKNLTAVNADQAGGKLYEFEVAKFKGDKQQELAIALKLTNDLPEFGTSYYYLGQAYQDLGQWSQAVQNYNTALRKKGFGSGDEDRTTAANMLKAEIDCYYKMNQPAQAKVAIEDGRRTFPDDSGFMTLKIGHEMKYGDPETAEKELTDLVAANPKAAELYLQLGAVRMQIARNKAKIPDRDAASAWATKARDAMSEAVKQCPDDARVYGSLADILLTGGDKDGAEKVLLGMDALPNFKGKTDAQIMLADLYERISQMDKSQAVSYAPKAEAAYAVALGRDSTKSAIRILYSELLTRHGKFDDALKVLSAGDPTDGRFGLEKINVLISAGRVPEAETGLQAVLDQNTAKIAKLQADAAKTGVDAIALQANAARLQLADAQLESAYAQLEMGRNKLSSATDRAGLALAADPQNVPALLVRSKLHMRQVPADPDAAIKDLTAARQVQPENIEVLTSMADVYLSRFDAAGARGALEAAVRVQPANVTLRLKLMRAYADLEPVRLDQALQVVQDGEALPGGDRIPELAIAQASIYKLQGDTKQARDTIIAALNKIPGEITLIRTYLQTLLDNKQYNDVLKGASDVIGQDKDKNFWWAWSCRGQAKAALADKSGAAEDLKHAFNEADALHDNGAAIDIVQTLAHDVDSQTAINLVSARRGTDPQWDAFLVLLYHNAGQDNLAIELLDPLVASADKLPAEQRLTRLQLAGMIYATATPAPLAQKAYEVYKQILNDYPNNVQALNNIASLCADSFTPPKVEEGTAYIERAEKVLTARGANDANVDDTYGWLLILGGQTQKGVEELTQAMAHGTFPEVYYHLGEGYLRENRPSEAQVQVTNALNAIAAAQEKQQPIAPAIRAKIADLSTRVMDSLRPRTSGNLP